MNLAGLSFNGLPPISLPFRFFITAPIFLLLCACFVFFSAENLWFSRWQPPMLALVHGFTLGFLTMVMLGALLQLLPVIGGIAMPYPKLIAGSSHLLVTLGSLSIMLGFINSQDWLLYSAVILLGLGLGIYLAALAWVLIKKISQGDSIIGFRLAVFALLITLLIGLALLARNLGLQWLPSSKQLTNIHALWGLIGWAGLLIIAVSFQVIPMFHVSPNFPKLITRYLPAGIFLLLILSVFSPSLALSLMALGYGIFAITLLKVINKRKRKLPDTSIRYWQLAAVTILVSITLYFIPNTLWQAYAPLDKTMLLAALFIYFFLLSVIQGMLLKILPFLSYTHLQQRCLMDFSAMQFIPNMHEFLNKKHGQGLFVLHIISGLLLILVLTKPSYYPAFGFSLALESSWLLFIMIKTMRLYYSIDTKISLSSSQ